MGMTNIITNSLIYHLSKTIQQKGKKERDTYITIDAHSEMKSQMSLKLSTIQLLDRNTFSRQILDSANKFTVN